MRGTPVEDALGEHRPDARQRIQLLDGRRVQVDRSPRRGRRAGWATRDLATKWAGHRINVNAIAPGWFPSDMNKVLLEAQPDAYLEHIPLRRFGGPDDLKGAVVFLASHASDFVTGQVVVVDGGQSAW